MQLKQLLSGIKEKAPSIQLSKITETAAIPSFLGVQAGQSLNQLTVYAKRFQGVDTLEKRILAGAVCQIGSFIENQTDVIKTRGGWINQKMAKKAIQRFDRALEQQDIGFSADTVISLTRLDSTIL